MHWRAHALLSGALISFATAAPLSRGAVVTPLRFKPHEPHADGSRRRLALRDGWRLDGNLHTLGYFAGARPVRFSGGPMVCPIVHYPITSHALLFAFLS